MLVFTDERGAVVLIEDELARALGFDDPDDAVGDPLAATLGLAAAEAEALLNEISASGGSRYRLAQLRNQRTAGEASDMVDGARRAMRATYQREMDHLERHLAFLASTGSVSPYVGLFGTVWGIMHAFRSLANVQQATLAQVAPGIAEALVATALGLFAAIPAVVAYNRYSYQIDRLSIRFESFMEEFSNILHRQAVK